MAGHSPEEYAEIGFGLRAGFAVAETDEGVAVSGECPRCGAATSMTFPPGSPQGTKGMFRRAPTPAPVRMRKVTVYCECGYAHPERPPESPESGCGAYWTVDLG
jgi:hypothetical protein